GDEDGERDQSEDGRHDRRDSREGRRDGRGERQAHHDGVTMLPRISLVHAPTPIVRRPALDAKLGINLWIKRDDATSGAEAGNKIRKLELLLGDAIAKKADTIITCGGLQSNHARATAIACAALGLRSVLFLRVEGDT